MKILKIVQSGIINIIGFVHKPFKKIIPLETFTYAICGASNTAFDIVLYFISYNFILDKQLIDLGYVVISPHIAAFVIAFSISFPTGFALNKYITFNKSKLRGIKQLFRYGLVVAVCILLNYVFLKLFVELFFLYPTPSKIITTIIVTAFSYFSQKYYTFKVNKN